MSRRRVIFMGTPAFVVPVLEALVENHDVIAVYSQPPRPAGRGYALQKSPVHECTDRYGIPVFTPKNFKDDADKKQFVDLKADVAVVAAYGLIVPKAVLDAPVFGCVNIHVSLLPRWRGASPIQYAIWKGDTETGVTIMKMDVGMDTGPIIAQEKMPIGPTTTSADLYDALFKLGAKMVVPILSDIQNAKLTPQPAAGMTLAPMLEKSDARIDWSQSAADIDRQIRAFNPWPGTFCMAGKKRLKIISATPTAGNGPAGTVINRAGHVACGTDALQLIQIQPEGGKPMDIASALNGGYLKEKDILT